tara:strand:+ start:1590 stop:2012 length:423 start_codon:yes stop_codon:yes gene_type:complete
MAEYDVRAGATFHTTLDGINMLPSTGTIADTAKFNGVLVSSTGNIANGTTVSVGNGASLVLQHSNSIDPATFTDVPSSQMNGSLPGPDTLIEVGAVARSLVGYTGKDRYLRVLFLDSVVGDMMFSGGVNIILLKGGKTPY